MAVVVPTANEWDATGKAALAALLPSFAANATSSASLAMASRRPGGGAAAACSARKAARAVTDSATPRWMSNVRSFSNARLTRFCAVLPLVWSATPTALKSKP